MSEARERWRELVAQWRSSEQTGREFAARRGVNPSTLAHWAWRLGQEPQDGSRAMARGPAMIEVCARPAGDDRFELELRGWRLRVPAAFDPTALGRLLTVLEDRS